MRVRQLPASPLYPKIRFAFTDYPLIVWAGAILLRLSLEPIGLLDCETGSEDLVTCLCRLAALNVMRRTRCDPNFTDFVSRWQ